jgi:hypothetical protein
LRRHEPNISRRPAEVGWRSAARRVPVGVDGVACRQASIGMRLEIEEPSSR